MVKIPSGAEEVEQALDAAAPRMHAEKGAMTLWVGFGSLLLERNPELLVAGDPRATFENMRRALADATPHAHPKGRKR